MTVADPPPADDLTAVLAPYLPLLGALRRGRPVDPGRASLVEAAAEVWSRPGFDVFLSRPSLGFEPFDYQWQTAQTVLRRMRGRAILADEVGLGKTIEAGLVLSELRTRGLGDRALVVVPAGLTEQWREELERKFALPATIATRREWAAGPAGRGDGAGAVAGDRDESETGLAHEERPAAARLPASGRW
jgi:superfamily II DNA or RNA helicase